MPTKKGLVAFDFEQSEVWSIEKKDSKHLFIWYGDGIANNETEVGCTNQTQLTINTKPNVPGE